MKDFDPLTNGLKSNETVIHHETYYQGRHYCRRVVYGPDSRPPLWTEKLFIDRHGTRSWLPIKDYDLVFRALYNCVSKKTFAPDRISDIGHRGSQP